VQCYASSQCCGGDAHSCDPVAHTCAPTCHDSGDCAAGEHCEAGSLDCQRGRQKPKQVPGGGPCACTVGDEAAPELPAMLAVALLILALRRVQRR
jgi:MYXO-CTERM domain-containing protein